MTLDAWITVTVVALTVFALARTRISPAAIATAGMILLLLTGVLTPQVALAGFANPAPFTVAALYVLAAAASKTGLLTPITRRLLPDDERRQARLLAPTAAVSAFFNNTPLVAMLIPDVLAWARRTKSNASKVLLPISFAAILGGMTTLIGTSTNLLVSGLLQANGEPPLGMFEFLPIGLPAALLGLGVLLTISIRLLPDRTGAAAATESAQREFVVGMVVEPGGGLDGSTVAEAGLRDLSGVYLVELEHRGTLVAPVAPSRTLEGGDVLTFVGGPGEVVDLQRIPGLTSTEQEHLLAIEGPGHTFFEAVIGRSSPLSGRTLKDVGFRSAYGAAVVAIHRDGQRVEGKLGGVRLQPGDTLLILGPPGFAVRYRGTRSFLLVAHLGGPPPSASRQAPLVGIAAVAMIVLAATGLVPILHGSLAVVGVLVITRVLTVSEARDAIDLDVILVIGASLALGAALVLTGVAETVGEALVDALAPLGSWGVIAGVVVATVLLTEVVTNNAAAVIMVPIAAAVALGAGLDGREMAIGVSVAASASFLGPLGYQTNTMVYGPGGYRLGDYVRSGLPVTVAVAAALVVTLSI